MNEKKVESSPLIMIFDLSRHDFLGVILLEPRGFKYVDLHIYISYLFCYDIAFRSRKALW